MKDNKLIAEFMGSKHPTIEDMYRLPHADVYWGELQYDYSWDWLMSVVEKIETISSKLPTHVGDLSLGYLTSTNIEETYIAVVRFIKEYNRLKQE